MVTKVEMDTLPFHAMKEGHSYTYVADVKHRIHLDHRRSVVDRVKAICDSKELLYTVYTPEELLALAHLMYDCTTRDCHDFKDSLIIIDGSDRAHVYTCVVLVPWTGDVYEIAGGGSLETDFMEWMVDISETARSTPGTRIWTLDPDTMRELVSVVCETYFFKVSKL